MRRDAFVGWLEVLQASGRYTFTKEVAAREGPAVERKTIWRAQREGRVIQPRSGFFVVVPPEYRSVGAPPATWFIDDLMNFEALSYYVGLLTAASLHGASPQAAQEFQVIVPVPQRPIVAGRLRIRFAVRSDLASAATEERQTPTGKMRLSTIEQTAFDLVLYPDASGGWDNVAAVLADLAPKLDAKALKRVAQRQHRSGASQRLGYLLELVHADAAARALAAGLDPRAHHFIVFEPKSPTHGAERSERWHLILNRQIDID